MGGGREGGSGGEGGSGWREGGSGGRYIYKCIDLFRFHSGLEDIEKHEETGNSFWGQEGGGVRGRRNPGPGSSTSFK